MKKSTITNHLRTVLLTALLSLAAIGGTHASPAASIPEPKITALQGELGQLGGERSSAVRERRTCKNIVRDALALLKTSPEAPNRYRVLAIILQSQKHLLGLENSEPNREALFETCQKLTTAPDDDAELRLEADLLLSDRDLTLANADFTQRAEALREIIQRYRDTPGESKSLKMASLIAPKIEAWELEEEILNTMDDRFMDDPGIIEFRRKFLGPSRLDVLFKGTFARADGVSMSFPIDRMGQLSIMVFWSAKTKGFENALEQINEHQDLYPDRIGIFSFNLDELPDAGAGTLESMGLDWTVMRLPGGKSSAAFRTYGERDPVAILVNAFGHVLLNPTENYGNGHGAAKKPYKIDDVRISEERYLAQLQSLLIGDFLVNRASLPKNRNAEAVPADLLDSLQDCFIEAPMRYRLTTADAVANYRNAEKISREIIAKHPAATDLWQVRNRRIIALMGIWKLTDDPGALEEAVKEARTSLATPLPPGADVAPRFCLAKDSLRRSDADAGAVLSALILDAGGANAPGSAHAAAAILALDANSKDLHSGYRSTLLAQHTTTPALWPVVSFLRDRYHTYHLLEANFTRNERPSTRSYLINHSLNAPTDPLPDIDLKTLDGKSLKLPKDNEGKLTLLMFIEPPPEPDAEFPVTISAPPANDRKKASSGVMQYAFEMAERHIHHEVQVVAAYLCDDADRVKKLAEKYAWPCQTAIVPGGLRNPLVQQLGILSADRIPNVFLLRRDGTVAWSISGFNYRTDFGYPFGIRLAMKVHIEVCDTQLAYEALKKRDFKEAARIFSGPFLPGIDERHRWTSPRFHGRALANIGLGDWDAALADIDVAIAAYEKGFDHAKDKPSANMIEMQNLRISILKKLGKDEDAKAAEAIAATPPTSYAETPYDVIHAKLGELRTK